MNDCTITSGEEVEAESTQFAGLSTDNAVVPITTMERTVNTGAVSMVVQYDNDSGYGLSVDADLLNTATIGEYNGVRSYSSTSEEAPVTGTLTVNGFEYQTAVTEGSNDTGSVFLRGALLTPVISAPNVEFEGVRIQPSGEAAGEMSSYTGVYVTHDNDDLAMNSINGFSLSSIKDSVVGTTTVLYGNTGYQAAAYINGFILGGFCSALSDNMTPMECTTILGSCLNFRGVSMKPSIGTAQAVVGFDTSPTVSTSVGEYFGVRVVPVNVQGVQTAATGVLSDMSNVVGANASVPVLAGKFVGDVTVSRDFVIGSFTTAERDALPAVNGAIRYNTTVHKFQGRANGAWVDLH